MSKAWEFQVAVSQEAKSGDCLLTGLRQPESAPCRVLITSRDRDQEEARDGEQVCSWSARLPDRASWRMDPDVNQTEPGRLRAATVT